MGACCSTEEDKENINIDKKSGKNKRPDNKKGGKQSYFIHIFYLNSAS